MLINTEKKEAPVESKKAETSTGNEEKKAENPAGSEEKKTDAATTQKRQ